MNGLYFYIPWFVLFVQSGTYKKTGELKAQIVFGVVALVLAIFSWKLASYSLGQLFWLGFIGISVG